LIILLFCSILLWSDIRDIMEGVKEFHHSISCHNAQSPDPKAHYSLLNLLCQSSMEQIMCTDKYRRLIKIESWMMEYVDDGGDSSSDVSDMHYAKGVMTIIYITVFLIGTPGNLWIICKLIQASL
ncbi:hypothetical protein NECAME_17427, partial [Necator americanus]